MDMRREEGDKCGKLSYNICLLAHSALQNHKCSVLILGQSVVESRI